MIHKIAGYYKKFRLFCKQTYNKHVAYLYIVCACFLTFFIECIAGFAASEYSNVRGIKFLLGSPYLFLCNALIVLMSLSITLIFKKRFFYICLISFLWVLLGLANAFLIKVRITPLTASDFALIGAAFKIIDKYLKPVHMVFIIVMLIVDIILLVVIFKKAPQVKHKIKIGRNIGAVAIIWILCIGSINLGRASNLIPKKFDNLRSSYFKYGFTYCFTNSLLNMGVIKPEEYNKKIVKNIDNSNKSSVQTEQVTDKPNIIFVQLESFFEVNDLKHVSFSKNPIPNFDNLRTQYPGGYMTVPVVGAGTVNTEFEIETGMSLEFFGSGEIPYNTYLQDRAVESICYNLKPYGYTSHVIHNNDATFYKRYEVFDNLGYDTFDSLETMNIQGKQSVNAKNWTKDCYLTDEIIKALESTEKSDFIYTITVQSHGKYNPEHYDSKIKVKGIEDEELKDSYEYFADQLYEVDQFIASLTERLQHLDEHTIVVFYGDHLPSLEITKDDLTTDNVFKTPYVIWNNYGNHHFKSRNLFTFQLQSFILQQLHMGEGSINICHQANLGKKYKKYKQDLHILTYDMMNEEDEEDRNRYQPTNLQMGIYPIKISTVSVTDKQKSEGYVYGKNFTQSCKIYINDTLVETEFLDESTLLIKDFTLQTGDTVAVRLTDSKGLDFYETDLYAYTEDTMG